MIGKYEIGHFVPAALITQRLIMINPHHYGFCRFGYVPKKCLNADFVPSYQILKQRNKHTMFHLLVQVQSNMCF